MRKISLLFTALLLSACQQNIPTNKPTVPAATTETNIQQRTTTEYVCKNDLTVRVINVHTPKQKSKLDGINVTFNGVTQKLQPTISESGKNYANIRWVWQQRDDYSTLKTSVGVILAEQCVAK